MEELLGMSADDLALLKEGSPEKQQQYQALLKKVQWQDYTVRLQTRTRLVLSCPMKVEQKLVCKQSLFHKTKGSLLFRVQECAF